MQRMAESHDHHRLPSPRLALDPFGFGFCLLIAQAGFIVTAALASGAVYHFFAYDSGGPLRIHAVVGAATALFFIAPALLKGQIAYDPRAARGAQLHTLIARWHVALAVVVLFGFLTKTTEMVSRGTFVGFYAAGLLGLMMLHAMAARLHTLALRWGRVRARRVIVIGDGARLAHVRAALAHGGPELLMIGEADLGAIKGASDDERAALLQARLDALAREARNRDADDVVIAAPLGDETMIDACLATFRKLPVTIHVDTGPRLRDMRLDLGQVALMQTVMLNKPPLEPYQRWLKRACDIAMASVGLVLLAPLFAGVAVLIRWQTGDTAFFRQ
ncbi:MAG: hypothetical protein AAFR04_15540, partial [Pseudomonadota bacterium]